MRANVFVLAVPSTSGAIPADELQHKFSVQYIFIFSFQTAGSKRPQLKLPRKVGTSEYISTVRTTERERERDTLTFLNDARLYLLIRFGNHLGPGCDVCLGLKELSLSSSLHFPRDDHPPTGGAFKCHGEKRRGKRIREAKKVPTSVCHLYIRLFPRPARALISVHSLRRRTCSPSVAPVPIIRQQLAHCRLQMKAAPTDRCGLKGVGAKRSRPT